MALTINNGGMPGARVKVDEKLWLTADKSRLVPDGHPDAAHLYCTPGKEVPAEEYERLKAASAAPETKQGPTSPPEDKSRAPAKTKGKRKE